MNGGEKFVVGLHYWKTRPFRDHMVLSERCPFRKPTNQDDSNGEIVKTYLAKI